MQGHEGNDALGSGFCHLSGNLGGGRPALLLGLRLVRDLVGVSDQGDVFEEVLQGGTFVVDFELTHGVHQLGEVLDAGFVLNILGFAQGCQVAGLLQHGFEAASC